MVRAGHGQSAHRVVMLAPKPLDELIEPGWAVALAAEAPTVAKIGAFLRAEFQEHGRTYLPAGANVLRAFTIPFDSIKVLIVGQDPYPTPGNPVGLSFSVDPGVRQLPGSLRNIFKELHDDLGIAQPANGDLTAWTTQGVMLLNRVLTVRPGEPGSHRGIGWEQVTEMAIQKLVARNRPLVAILWGRDAISLKPMLGATPVIESSHPSPLSASRGFFGSRPFSRANALLEQQGASPVDWRL